MLDAARIARVALRFPFPEQYALVFNNLTAATGVGALVSVATFLDRLDELESSPERKATRKIDHAALAKLAERGITPEERARMRALLSVATGAGVGTVVPSTQEQSLIAELEATFDEWAEVARVVIKRRSDLIRLGLVKRRKVGKGQPDEVSSEPLVLAPEPLALPGPAPEGSPSPEGSPEEDAPIDAAPAPAPVFEPIVTPAPEPAPAPSPV